MTTLLFFVVNPLFLNKVRKLQTTKDALKNLAVRLFVTPKTIVALK